MHAYLRIMWVCVHIILKTVHMKSTLFASASVSTVSCFNLRAWSADSDGRWPVLPVTCIYCEVKVQTTKQKW